MSKMRSWWGGLSAKKRGYLFFAVVSLVLLVVAIPLILGPSIPEEFCTLVDCLENGVTLKLENLPADSSYQIEVKNSAGEALKLSCGDAQEGTSPQCSSEEEIYIYLEANSAPEELTVNLKLNDQEISEVLYPDYEISQPNGENCPPTCYSATVIMKVP